MVGVGEFCSGEVGGGEVGVLVTVVWSHWPRQHCQAGRAGWSQTREPSDTIVPLVSRQQSQPSASLLASQTEWGQAGSDWHSREEQVLGSDTVEPRGRRPSRISWRNIFSFLNIIFIVYCCPDSSCGRRTPARCWPWGGPVWSCRPRTSLCRSRPPAGWWRSGCWPGRLCRYRSDNTGQTRSSPSLPSPPSHHGPGTLLTSHICN